MQGRTYDVYSPITKNFLDTETTQLYKLLIVYFSKIYHEFKISEPKLEWF